ncbi:sensor histidine kinase [Nitrospira sp. Kam-Ns4a]
MKFPLLTGILAWVIGTGVCLVGVTIVLVNLLDRRVIEQAAERNLQAEFRRAAGSVSRLVRNAGDHIHDTRALREAFQDIFELRPGIRWLEVFAFWPGISELVLSSDPQRTLQTLSAEERAAVEAGRTYAVFDDSVMDRAWIITAPIQVEGHVEGALRGRFSLWKYDRLIRAEAILAKEVGVGAVAITCLIFLVLIRVTVHQPISRLLCAMRQAEAGDLTSRAPLMGPSDLQEVSRQYNRMLGRVREAIAERERLLGEIRGLNQTLITRVAEATEELRQTTLLLVEARTQAERAQKLAALGEFSAVVAHELGTPLSAISGHLQMLANDTDQQDRYRRVAIIRSELARMTEIIRHILDSTQVRIQIASVDLNEVVQQSLALIVPVVSTRNITLQTNLAPALPAAAGDSTALKGVLFNLLTNAIQAMSNGGTLSVTTVLAHDSPPDGVVMLSGSSALAQSAIRLLVGDTGQGIPPEHLARIFEPFFTTRASGGGSGLGLAVCHRVVASCGGRLAVRSEVGRGTVFTVDLPVWMGEAADDG